jgi:hypothetical protein
MAFKKADLTAAAQTRAAMDVDKLKFIEWAVGERGFKSTYVFIAPPHENMNTFFEATWMHFGIGTEGHKRTIGCPRKMFNQTCPVCEYGFFLLESNKKEQARAYWPSPNFMLNCFKCDKDGNLLEETAYVLGAGNTLFNLIWDEFKPNEQGVPTVDCTDPDGGRIFVVKAHQTEKTFNGKKVAEYKVQLLKDEPTKFPGDFALLDNITDLSKVNQFLEPSEALALLTGGAAPGTTTENPWAGPESQLPAGEENIVEGQYREVTDDKTTPSPVVPEDEEEEEEIDPDTTAASEPTVPAATATQIDAAVDKIAEKAVNGTKRATPAAAAAAQPSPAVGDLQAFLKARGG